MKPICIIDVCTSFPLSSGMPTIESTFDQLSLPWVDRMVLGRLLTTPTQDERERGTDEVFGLGD